jgi:DNA-binding CsgD family transcriptional regulator
VAGGDSDDEIARRLNISRRTVETHRYNITKKLGLNDASALRKYAIQLGMWFPDTQEPSS